MCGNGENCSFDAVVWTSRKIYESKGKNYSGIASFFKYIKDSERDMHLNALEYIVESTFFHIEIGQIAE